MRFRDRTVAALLALLACAGSALAQSAKNGEIDQRVGAFLAKMRGEWRDMNVPYVDGQILYDIIVKKNYRRALEIGTSTGHSAIWIAWAMSKTGGKLVTIELDERRYRQALENFKQAGLSDYIDARLADAHELVPQLAGPWDFVFLDADKDWYTNYAKAVIPRLLPGGCLAAHNIPMPGAGRRGRGMSGTAEYYEYMRSLPEFETTVLSESQAGVSVSYKKKSQN
jgi:caffeoyl-CoA O-methyltransferase